MLTLTNNATGEAYKVPICWNQMSWIDYLDIVAGKSLLGLPENVAIECFDVLENTLDFVKNVDIPYNDYDAINILKETFGKFVTANALIAQNTDENGVNQESCLIWLIACYLSDNDSFQSLQDKYNELLTTNVPQYYSLGVDLLGQVIEINQDLNNHFKEYKLKKRPEMQGVGWEDLEVYGYYNVIDNLANKEVLKHQDIENLTLNQVVLKLKYDAQKAYYEEKTQENQMNQLKSKK
jgi:hypothetical protein